MSGRPIVGLVLALTFLLSTAIPAFAVPSDVDSPARLPPGLAKRTFIHYEINHARSIGLLPAPAKGGGTARPGGDNSCPEGSAEYGSPSCDMYVNTGLKWRAGTTFSYYVNPNSTTPERYLSDSSAIDAIRLSFDAWDVRTTALTYRYGGTTTLVGGVYDSQNVVSWGTLDPGVLAVTVVWYYPRTSEIVQADIVFNNYFTWSYTDPQLTCNPLDYTCEPSTTGPRGTFDVRSIGTHEAGHTLMLGDLYDLGASALTMFGYGSEGELRKDTLGYGDILGVAAIYRR